MQNPAPIVEAAVTTAPAHRAQRHGVLMLSRMIALGIAMNMFSWDVALKS